MQLAELLYVEIGGYPASQNPLGEFALPNGSMGLSENPKISGNVILLRAPFPWEACSAMVASPHESSKFLP